MPAPSKLNTASTAQALADPDRASSLNKVLKKNEHAKGLLEEAADELSSVNTVLKEKLTERVPPPEVEVAIEKSEKVEAKVHEVSDKLTDVNRALVSEVRERVMLEHQIAAVTEQEEAARYAAFHDPLTGLPNRLLFHDRLEHGMAQAERHGWSLAVMFVDLDGFKLINDSYGHDAGDKVLQAIAGRLKQGTRSDDTVSRYGGDEFLYLLMEIGSEADVVLIAEKVRATISLPCDVGLDNATVRPTVAASVGIAIYPRDGTTVEALIRSADAAMYRAKQRKCGHAFAQQP